MQVVSVSDFNNNFRSYDIPVQIVENGIKIGKYIPSRSSFFARFFSKKKNNSDGELRPTGRLRAALRESKRMMKQLNHSYIFYF